MAVLLTIDILTFWPLPGQRQKSVAELTKYSSNTIHEFYILAVKNKPNGYIQVISSSIFT
ncbi:hypothetical protein M2137_000589 [Parabacteroides sp. PFB2-10]|nr:hypothetical protein [Parabacteroides sp. PFB2-10]